MQKAFDCLSTKKKHGGSREPGSPVAHHTPLERLRVLLEHHKLPDVAIDDYRDPERKTLLIAAAACGHEEVVEYLLGRGASPNETDERGWTALMCSAAHRKPKVCMMLLSEPGIDVNIAHSGGGTALFLAAHSGLGEVVHRLIELGADFHKQNFAGFAPVMMAIDGGHPKIAKELIEAGVELDNADNLVGITALHLSVFVGDGATAERILVRLSDDEGRKMRCINRRTKFGLSALHRAVACGNLTTAQLLLEHGADPNMAEGEKRSISILKSLTRTAYAHKAIDAQQPGFQSMMVSLLLNRSPHDSMDTLGEGATPLHYAAKSGDAPMIKLLLASGADPRLKVKKSKLSAVDFAIKATTAALAKKKDDLVDVEVVFDGVEGDEGELGFAESASSVLGLTESVAAVADQLTEAAMRFVPEGTSFEVVRVAVVGGIVLIVLSFVKGLLSLAIAVGTVGFGAYLYTSIYGEVGGKKRGSTRRARSGRSRTKKKKATTKSTAGGPTFSAGNILSDLINSTGTRRPDDGLLDVTFKKPSKPRNPKKR